MHTVWARANALFFYMITAMGVVGVLCDLSSYVMEHKIPQTHIPDISVKSV